MLGSARRVTVPGVDKETGTRYLGIQTTRRDGKRIEVEGGVTITNIPSKPLPPTGGGLPVHLTVGGSILAGAGPLALRFATQRGHHR